MKISLEWLRDYLPGDLAAQKAADTLTNGGLPVEVIEQVGDDTVIDVEVTSNRGDCLSHVGVARELAALLDWEFKSPAIEAPETAPACTSVTSVKIEALELCPHYTARVIRGVKIGPSPAWLARRLEAVGVRPVNNVVDVTNYVMMELGQPLHAFDFDRLNEGRIVVRTAKPGETLRSIDGHDRKLTPDMLVIADGTRAVALAGVMGGIHSEVSDQSVNVLLESARFDALSVRRTARALTMKSEASYRFERGIDPALPERASLRAAQLILQTAGGQLLSGYAEDGVAMAPTKRLSLRLARLKQLLGVELPSVSVINAFSRLNLAPVLKDDRIEVTIPSYRLDLNIEADLVEEAARVIGYDKIPVHDEISIRLAPPDPRLVTTDQIRGELVAGGYFEAVTVTFLPDALTGEFLPPEAASLPRTDPQVRKADAHLRPSLLPSLLEVLRRNEAAGNGSVKLFEIASTFWTDQAGRIEERRRLCLVGPEDVRETRGMVEALLTRLDAARPLRILPEGRRGFAPAAAGRIEWGGRTVGWLGQIDRRVCEKIDLRTVPTGAELELNELLDGAQHVPQLQPLPRFPAVRRDLSLVVPDSMRFEQIERLLRGLKLEHLEDLEFVTTYRGKPLEKGTKSVTTTLVFRSPAATLTSEQVESSVQKAIDAAKSQLGATLRA